MPRLLFCRLSRFLRRTVFISHVVATLPLAFRALPFVLFGAFSSAEILVIGTFVKEIRAPLTRLKSENGGCALPATLSLSQEPTHCCCHPALFFTWGS
jgi:hypothetical protein